MACPTVQLDAGEIQSRLEQLPGWCFKENALERVYDGRNYLGSLAVLNEIARLSEGENHHPDLLLSWKKLSIRFWTHTAKGVTELDFELARKVEAVLIRHAKPA